MVRNPGILTCCCGGGGGITAPCYPGVLPSSWIVSDIQRTTGRDFVLASQSTYDLHQILSPVRFETEPSIGGSYSVPAAMAFDGQQTCTWADTFDITGVVAIDADVNLSSGAPMRFSVPAVRQARWQVTVSPASIGYDLTVRLTMFHLPNDLFGEGVIYSGPWPESRCAFVDDISATVNISSSISAGGLVIDTFPGLNDLIAVDQVGYYYWSPSLNSWQIADFGKFVIGGSLSAGPPNDRRYTNAAGITSCKITPVF